MTKAACSCQTPQLHRVLWIMLPSIMYKPPFSSPFTLSLRPNMLQPRRTMHKVIRVCLGDDPSLIRLLHKILVPLLIRKVHCRFLTLKVQMCALHEVGRRLPAHERILPSMAFGKYIPVHAPVVPMPVAGLGCGFGRAVDPRWEVSGTLEEVGRKVMPRGV